ncbi:hypothetical protein [Amycolatopsis sp. cmx-4-54]|uniref:hypothetical protein n=1 Tax=Amycolatopsis sp. cmx-4-54 TaxID=2790936 RepID=UPI00397AF8A3
MTDLALLPDGRGRSLFENSTARASSNGDLELSRAGPPGTARTSTLSPRSPGTRWRSSSSRRTSQDLNIKLVRLAEILAEKHTQLLPED